jgi:hypothetical protein
MNRSECRSFKAILNPYAIRPAARDVFSTNFLRVSRLTASVNHLPFFLFLRLARLMSAQAAREKTTPSIRAAQNLKQPNGDNAAEH